MNVYISFLHHCCCQHVLHSLCGFLLSVLQSLERCINRRRLFLLREGCNWSVIEVLLWIRLDFLFCEGIGAEFIEVVLVLCLRLCLDIFRRGGLSLHCDFFFVKSDLELQQSVVQNGRSDFRLLLHE